MAANGVTTVAEAIHKIQLRLLDGITNESHLFAAAILLSRPDYNDVVTERSISNICGYPLCQNPIGCGPHKNTGRKYRVSVKEHKVYDLQETYLYCGSKCLIDSKAFAGSLAEERCLVASVGKINEVLRVFDDDVDGVGEGKEKAEEDLKANLVIKEKEEVGRGEVSMEEWMGEAGAIEGYVPQRDRKGKLGMKGNVKSGKNKDVVQNEADFEISVKPNEKRVATKKVQKNGRSNHSETLEPWVSEINFNSVILTNDEYSVSKKSDVCAKPVGSGAKSGSVQKKSGSKKEKGSIFGSMDFMSTIITEDEYSVSKLPPSQAISDTNQAAREFSSKLNIGDSEKQFKNAKDSVDPEINVSRSYLDSAITGASRTARENGSIAEASSHHGQNHATSSSGHVEEDCTEPVAGKTTAKSSLRTSGDKKAARSVSWADEKPNNGVASKSLCEFQEFNSTREQPSTLRGKDVQDNGDSDRYMSAEACAMALCQAAEAVAAGQVDAADAVTEAGIMVIPQPDAAGGKDQSGEEAADRKEHSVEDDDLEVTDTVKWPQKPESLDSEVSDSDSSWFDNPPEGFSVTLSPFAMMWNAIFSWITSSSVAYIYGRDDSFHEEYLSVNGREYPRKVMLPDGRSSEIEKTLAGCLSRALAGLTADLKLSTPVSTLEKGLDRLLSTMSFMDALPPFRMRQWQVIVLLFIDALSVCRFPGLTPHITSRRILIPKVLKSAQITTEEYEIMKDLVIPLGRVPQFSMQSGG